MLGHAQLGYQVELRLGRHDIADIMGAKIGKEGASLGVLLRKGSDRPPGGDTYQKRLRQSNGWTVAWLADEVHHERRLGVGRSRKAPDVDEQVVQRGKLDRVTWRVREQAHDRLELGDFDNRIVARHDPASGLGIAHNDLAAAQLVDLDQIPDRLFAHTFALVCCEDAVEQLLPALIQGRDETRQPVEARVLAR